MTEKEVTKTNTNKKHSENIEDSITSDFIINHLKKMVESKKSFPRDEWLGCAFKLNLLRIDESQLLNRMRQSVAQKKLAIMRSQDKKNVSAASLELEATDEYRFMRDQESKIEAIEEFVRIAKKSVDMDF